VHLAGTGRERPERGAAREVLVLDRDEEAAVGRRGLAADLRVVTGIERVRDPVEVESQPLGDGEVPGAELEDELPGLAPVPLGFRPDDADFPPSPS
jgi:hypothetical protein